MSTDWYWRLSASLNQGIVDEATLLAASGFSELPFGLVPVPRHRATRASFGPGIRSYLSSFEGISGFRVGGGMLSAGIWSQNLEREADEGPGAMIEAGASRLDVLFAFLSSVTTSGAGRIVGCISSEADHDHAHPIVSFSMGRVGIVRTEPEDREEWFARDISAVVADKLPVEALRFVGPHEAELDRSVLEAAWSLGDGRRMRDAPQGTRVGRVDFSHAALNMIDTLFPGDDDKAGAVRDRIRLDVADPAVPMARIPKLEGVFATRSQGLIVAHRQSEGVSTVLSIAIAGG